MYLKVFEGFEGVIGGERDTFFKKFPFLPLKIIPSSTQFCMSAVGDGWIGGVGGRGVFHIVENTCWVTGLFRFFLWLFYFGIDVARVGGSVRVCPLNIHNSCSFLCDFGRLHNNCSQKRGHENEKWENFLSKQLKWRKFFLDKAKFL